MQKYTDNDMQFDLAIIDADSIMYQIAFVEASPALCKKNLDKKLADIMELTGAPNGVVFIKGANNFRYQVDIAYKGNRKDIIEPEVKDRIDMLYEYAKDFCVAGDNGEADDLCSITARKALDEGKTFIVSHIDKDLNAISGWHHNFRTNEIYHLDDMQSYRFLMSQLLTGDATDNIQGLRGVGLKTAEKLIKDTPNIHLWDKVIEIWKGKQPETWYNNFVKCANCIYIREFDEDLRPLSMEELKDRLTWLTTDIGTPLATSLTEPLDSSTTLKTSKQEDDTLEESN
jgi:5'-3' exonuclease